MNHTWIGHNPRAIYCSHSNPQMNDVKLPRLVNNYERFEGCWPGYPSSAILEKQSEVTEGSPDSRTYRRDWIPF